MEETRQHPAVNRREALLALLAAPVAHAFLSGCSGANVNDDPLGPSELVTADWASGRNPDDWHRLALFGNYDFIDAAAFRWIADQPTCDRATALAMFWMHQPEYYAEFATQEAVPAVNRRGFDLISHIRQRWESDAYSRSEIAFDREADVWPVDFAQLECRFGARVAAVMPPSMRIDLSGRRVALDGLMLPGNF